MTGAVAAAANNNIGVKNGVNDVIFDTNIGGAVVAEAIKQAAAVDTKFSQAGWRIEVKGRGKYFQYRRGSGKDKESMYGGKFENLTEARKRAYETNKKSYARR